MSQSITNTLEYSYFHYIATAKYSRCQYNVNVLFGFCSIFMEQLECSTENEWSACTMGAFVSTVQFKDYGGKQCKMLPKCQLVKLQSQQKNTYCSQKLQHILHYIAAAPEWRQWLGSNVWNKCSMYILMRQWCRDEEEQRHPYSWLYSSAGPLKHAAIIFTCQIVWNLSLLYAYIIIYFPIDLTKQSFRSFH